MSVETPPEVLPIQPPVRVLKLKHIDTRDGIHTIIGRKVDRPDLCTRCRGVACNHDGGFCIVEAPEFVAPELCAGYVLRASPAEGQAGLGVEGG